ncbi:50S ribosomal protein L18Ae [Methanotrichaceae archaeon M04Ac]|jgi:large subunit ribosomal protein LX|uniref:Large ribosomal subunit protein eL20 n=1 Tax=Candidatus Methanocrinis alkalitolerans TaxID=3033395 RepID=A0ABT5XH13_9EURY|nr:50S ribosomal protein L18Ae [Candidatus Methanocrinis alkalitolerans]MCR3882955.1 50S ribosomal protein L18Ae [Methanothrix sp.]MDF0593994.1 50S ribosomal protein L18Ae [Candidatus Methanocrinis alkalitolerans]
MVDFEIKGKFKVKNSWQSFSKVIESNSEKNAVEKAYSLLGSKQGVKRNLVKIEEVKALG